MAFQLVVVQGRSANTALKIGAGVMTVGRQQDCQLRIASSQVSRKHCQIFEKKGLLLVKDLGSFNGTLVNGKKIVDQRVLEPGDELTVGAVVFRVERTDDTVLDPGTVRPSSGAKPGDTAVAASIGDDDVIEFDEDGGAPQTTSPPSKSAVAPAKDDETVELSEDAVAEYLLNIDLDDEDKS